MVCNLCSELVYLPDQFSISDFIFFDSPLGIEIFDAKISPSPRNFLFLLDVPPAHKSRLLQKAD